MRNSLLIFLLLIAITICSSAASKPHLISFGKWQTAKWFVGASEDRPVEIRLRALFVDGKLREYIAGSQHEVTERLFVVRRVFHVNDNLPGDNSPSPHWLWQRGGWLLMDRTTGRISPLALPDFDAYLSSASWYRDYIAYCGVSEDGTKLFAIVMQMGRRKPVLHKLLGAVDAKDIPDSACEAPVWERQPARVSFVQKDGQRMMFSIRRRTLDVISDTQEDQGTE
jgi:hypothetical protein